MHGTVAAAVLSFPKGAAVCILSILCIPVDSARGAAPAQDPSLAAAEADIDFDKCVAWGDGRALGTIPREAVLRHLGLATDAGDGTPWRTEPVRGMTRHFRVAFTRPIPAGTICTDYAGGARSVSILDADAPYPGDPADEVHWKSVPARAVVTLPPGTRLRAIRFTHEHSPMPWNAGAAPSAMARALVLKGRFWNPAELGGSEWSTARSTVKGDARGGDREGEVRRWVGFWPRELALAAVAFDRQPGPEAVVRAAPGGTGQHPLVSEPDAWRKVGLRFAGTGPRVLPVAGLRRAEAASAAQAGGVAARAIEVRAGGPWGKRSRRGGRPLVMPLVALGDDEPAPRSFVPPPPFAFDYEMPLDGFVAIRASDGRGRDVRRLVAEVERSRGVTRETWDLKDDRGAYVEPGTYRWRGIARPPLRLTYMNTVYNAGRPPWPAPVPGGGWWMADHTPPRAVCATEAAMFFGSPGGEYGVDLIATDFDGRKLWHTSHQPVELLVSDGRRAYVVNNDAVTRIDPRAGFARRKILSFKYTDELPGHGRGWILTDTRGAACRGGGPPAGGKLYVSYDAAGPPWIRSSVSAGDVDFARCFPPPPLKKKVHDTELNPYQRMLSAFQLMRSSQQAEFGPALGGGSLRNTLVLALRREVPVGSVLVPDGVQVRALRPGKGLPGRFSPRAVGGGPGDAGDSDDMLGDEDDGLDFGLDEGDDARFDEAVWVRLDAARRGGPGMATPKHGMRTRALAFTGDRLGKLRYAMALDRRYRDAAADAKLVILEGKREGPRGWTTTRGGGNPIAPRNAPTAGLIWPKPVPLRGFAIAKPMLWAGVAVDIWAGPAGARVDEAAFGSDEHWKQVHVYRKSDNSMKFGWHTDYVVKGDFGRVIPVRALRVRIVDPPRRPMSTGTTFKGGFEALVAFEPIGNDVELPKSLAERITVIELPPAGGKEARIVRHLACPGPGAMAFDGSGALYVKTAKGIARARDIDKQADRQEGSLDFEVVIPPEQAGRARAMAFDSEGKLYVLDGESRCIKVFDPATGRLLRAFAGPGGLGPWDPDHLDAPSDMAIDGNGKLWIVDQMYVPKRITRWSREGVCEKELMGGTNYGGGGMMDPGDRTVVNHLGMKFRIDYDKGTWRLESRYGWKNSRGAYSPDRIMRYKGRRYMVGDRSAVVPEFNDRGPVVQICEEKEGVAVPRVAAGLVAGLLAFDRSDEVAKAFGKLDPDKTSFLWRDLDRDGRVRPREVQTAPGDMFRHSRRVGEDMSLNFHKCRLRPRGARDGAPGAPDDGLPLYDIADLETVPELDHETIVAPDGGTFVMGHKFLDRDGRVAWTYPDEYAGVQASNRTPFGFTQRPPGVLCGSFSALGWLRVAGEDLFCVNGNHGDYFAFTRDGLLAAAILGGPAGHGRRFFSGPEAVPGETDLTGLRTTVEDFRGHVCRADDGKVYAVAGKSHITVVRVDGLEGMRRLEGSFTVTRDDVRKTMSWADEKAKILQAMRRPAIFTVPYLTAAPKIDGDVRTDWPLVEPMEIRTIRSHLGGISAQWLCTLGFDERCLYVAARAVDESPLANSAREKATVFQGGDGLDIQLGLDPAADPRRERAAPGDVRLVLARMGGAATAMLYRYSVAGPRLGGVEKTFTSPVGEEHVDEIVEVARARLAFTTQKKGWALEAAIPWESMGAGPPGRDVALRGDVGALVSDPNGVATVTRFYWSNRQTVVMGDLPSEARVLPALWGELRFRTPEAGEEIEDILDDPAAR